MAYDEGLAARIRELLDGEPDITEQRMFGGLAFLARGRMAACATREGLMARVDPAQTEAMLAQPGAGVFEMRGRPLEGWIRVDADAVATRDALRAWVDRGLAYARGLPPKG